MNASSRYRFAAAGILAIILFALAQAQGAEIPGKVRSSTNKYATVVSDSDLVPVPGNKAKIYFKLPGIDVEVSVATGHVYKWRVVADLSRSDVPTQTEIPQIRARLSTDFPFSVLSPTWRKLLNGENQ